MKTLDLVRAAPHVRLHKDAVFVLKVGGGSLRKPAALRRFAEEVAVVHALGSRLVVVHGGGPQSDELQRLFGEEPRKVDGRRVTTPAALRALRQATAGELTGSLTLALGQAGVPAVGVHGTTDGLLVARRRPPVVTSGGVVDFGEVGDLVASDPAPLLALLADGRVPVVSPPASDGAGGALNVNADLTAAELAIALGAPKLVLVTGAPGVLRTAGDPTSLCSTLTLAELEELGDAGHLQDGMAVKAAAIARALEGGVGRVHVVSGAEPGALLQELYTNQGSGTLVTLEAPTVPAAADLAAEVTT